MRYVAISALAAAFWLAVATFRLVIQSHLHSPGPEPLESVAAAPLPPPVLVPVPAAPPVREPCNIEGWPEVRRDAWLTFHDARCGISAAKPRMWACQRRFADESWHAHMHVVVGKSGRVVSAKFSAAPAESSLAACLEAAMKSVTYPRSNERFEFTVAWQGLE